MGSSTESAQGIFKLPCNNVTSNYLIEERDVLSFSTPVSSILRPYFHLPVVGVLNRSPNAVGFLVHCQKHDCQDNAPGHSEVLDVRQHEHQH